MHTTHTLILESTKQGLSCLSHLTPRLLFSSSPPLGLTIFSYFVKRIIARHLTKPLVAMSLRKLLLLLGLSLSLQCLLAQQDLNITIISDGEDRDTSFFQERIKTEIKALLDANYNIRFTAYYGENNIATIQQYINQVYESNQTDVLIGAGLLTSRILSERTNYTIPTIAAINIDNLFSGNGNAEKTSSAIPNFTYIQSPFNIEKDLEVLTQINDVKRLAILVEPVLKDLGYNIETLFPVLEDIEVSIITIENSPQATLAAIDEATDAVYVLSPLERYTPSQSKALFQGIIEKKLPCFSLIDDPMLEYGAYAAFSSSENLQKIPRRTALNVSKIAEGQDPKDFSVQMESFSSQLLINMESVNKTGVYPNWTVMDDAILVNINKLDTERRLSLQSAIAEGLENNLDYHIAQKQTQITQKEVSLAKSNYLPQLDVTSKGLFLDKNTVGSSFGSVGDFNWSAGASFSQLILSEPAMANIAIQKLLKESQEKSQKQSELDVVLDVVAAFFNYQQVRSIAEVRNENIKVKNENLKIAVNKEKVGYSGGSDVYRWESELALAKVDFNNAKAQLKAVQFQLNQTLNRPIDEAFTTEQPENSDYVTQLFESSFVELIGNQGALKMFADFIVEEAMINLPEIQQIELALKAQERLLQSNQRESYIPSIVFGANYDSPLSVVNAGESIPGVNISPYNRTWDAAIVASFPIFKGGARSYQQQKSKIELLQLQDQRQDIRNKLEFQVRANVENLYASYRNYQLTRDAARAGAKNLSIVQDLYNQGQVNVTPLIDAQNAYFGAEINATNAQYQLILDLFTLERSMGQYLTLAPPEQKAAFIAKFVQYKNR